MYLVRPPFLLQKYYNEATWRIKEKEKTLYLTFDDGPVPEVTPWVLETLNNFQAKASFFCVGENTSKYPEIHQHIIAENHVVGNHTYNHLNGWNMNTPDYIKNIEKCSTLINSCLFRPPYGKLKYSQYKLLRDKYKIVMWDVLSGDFDGRTNKEKCLENTLNYSRPGSIVVFHDSQKASENLKFALPRFLEEFSNKGYQFKTL